MKRILSSSLILYLSATAMVLAAKTPRVEAEAAPTLPMAPILGADWTNRWFVPQTNKNLQYTIAQDELLQTPTLVSTGKPPLEFYTRNPVTSGVEITAWIRLTLPPDKDSSQVVLDAARDPTNARVKGLTVSLNGKRNSGLSVNFPPLVGNRFMHSDPALCGVPVPAAARSAKYELRAYPTVLPTLDPIIRASLEHDMNQLPWSQDKWIQVRYQLGQDWARIWVDDRLVVDHSSPDLRTSGRFHVRLGPGSRLASCTIVPLAAVPSRFEPIPMTGYVRDRNLAGNERNPVGLKPEALPFGTVSPIAGVPFAFADPARSRGADHVDVGRSLLREANMQGYGPVKTEGTRFADAFTIDPSRLRFRIPNGRYVAAHLVAAFDGEPPAIPLVSLVFYRPEAGFAMAFEGEVPAYTADTAAGATAVPVELDNGSPARLWKISLPLDPGRLSSFADMGFLEVELTKRVEQYRSYPDPILYGWHGAGLPSGVHVYALTFERSEVDFEASPAVFGHTWEAQDPVYNLRLVNRTDAPRPVVLSAETVSDDGQETNRVEARVTVPAGGQPLVHPMTLPVKKNGIHSIRLTMQDGGQHWTETRTFARLHKDTRDAAWSGRGTLFGYWGYRGGHYTPPGDATDKLMQMAGARAPHHPANAWPVTPQRAWAGKEPLDPAQVAAFRTNVIAAIRQKQGDNPEIITFFAEPHISRDLTAGNLATYWNQPEPPLTEEEALNTRIFFNTAKIAAEAVRAQWPKATILIPWGDTLFVVPLLRAGFPKELIDGSGIDVPGFERLPEQQLHQISFHRLYCLREEYRKFGMPNPKLWFMEGTFVPTEPGACTWQEQADYHDRWALVSMGYGVDRFYSGWFAFDACSYYGSEHYGGCGIQRRIPYCNPKPAYAHYATMTRQLEQATWNKWLPTGSLSTYCVRFDRPAGKGGPVHVLWTLRGRRPVKLTPAGKAKITVTDANDNDAVPEADAVGAVTVLTGPSPVYVAGAEAFSSVQVGEPDHSDSVQSARDRNRKTWLTGPLDRGPEITHEAPIASLGDGTWTLTDTPDVFDEVYEGNNFDTKRYRGRMSVSIATNTGRPSAALAVRLEKQDKEIPLMPWYSDLAPAQPVTIPGCAKALGLWVRGASDWGRVVYCLRDANDEMWISIGTKDQWNCDDVHSWSSFNFDGWRYLRFELPGHTPWDTFREYGTTWWRYAGGKKQGVGVVDYPLRVEKVIVERRTHILYVNDVQPTGAESNDVLLAELVAEYGRPEDATARAVEISRLRMPIPEPDAGMANPIRDMAAAGTLPATEITGIRNPDWGYDGTICHVDFKEVEGASEYQVWVAAHPDGRGAVQMAKMKTSGGAVRNLAPAMKLYLWVTYAQPQTEEQKKAKATPSLSKPSAAREIELVDAFGQK